MTAAPRSPAVFISYSVADRGVAEAVCDHLEGDGLSCWIAPRNIIGGDWSAAIVDAISESRIFLLILSQDSNESPQVKREVERAASKGIELLPYRIADFDLSKHMEYFISTSHWIDAADAPLGHLDRLRETVQELLGQKAAPDRSGGGPRPAGGWDEALLTPLKKLFPPPPPAGWRPGGGLRRWLAAVAAALVALLGIFFGLRGLLAVALPETVQPDGIFLTHFPLLRLTGLFGSGGALLANVGLLMAAGHLLRGRAGGLALAWGFARALAIVIGIWLLTSELAVAVSGDPNWRTATMAGIFNTGLGALLQVGVLLGLLRLARV